MNLFSKRFLAASLLTIMAVAAGSAGAAQTGLFDELLEASLKDKKGVMVYVNGQAIAGRVTRIDSETVELASREYARIVVRRERIDAVAAN